MNPGDVVFTHRNKLPSRLITFWQKRRYPPEYAHWSHVAIVTSYNGDLVEAQWSGVKHAHLDDYANREYKLVDVIGSGGADWVTRSRVIAFAEHQIGRDYGYIELVSLFFFLLMGGKFSFGIDGQMICSGLAAGALSRTDAIFPKEPAYMLPADLAEFYKVG